MSKEKNNWRLNQRYEEERARLVLLNTIFNEYYDSFLSESPDIVSYDRKIGTEVVDAKKEKLKELEAHTDSIVGKDKSELTKNDVKNIESGEVEVSLIINNKIAAAGPPAYWGGDFDFTKCITKKLQLLNTENFNKYQENRLFIFAWMLDRSDIIVDRTYEEISNIEYKNYEIVFDVIYIFTGSMLIEFKIKDNQYSEIQITHEKVKKISKDAYENIFKKKWAYKNNNNN